MTPEEDQKWWAEYGPDSPFEWDFDPVPDEELIACCFWEYARESKTIKLLADVHWCITRDITYRQAYERDPSLIDQHNERAEMIAGWVKRAGFDYDAVMDRYWKYDFAFLGIYQSVTELVRDGASPWRRLPPGLREHVTRTVNRNGVLRPLSLSTVGELEELWKANSMDLLEIRSTDRDEMNDSEDAALWSESTAIEPSFGSEDDAHERMTAALTVDFSRFTDNEIIAAFGDWVKKQRPAQWKQPRRVLPGARQRGRKLVEYRVALERLGLMRLLHNNSPAELSETLPEAWKKIRRKEPDFRREVREATKFFRSLFLFLPEEEKPTSEERVGVWFPQLRKRIEEHERSTGQDGGSK